MTAESASDRHYQWAVVVRRSFGIPDLVAEHDAREVLVGSLVDQLHEKGWQSPARGIAEPIVAALMMLGTVGDLGDPLLPTELRLSTATFTCRVAAHRLLEKGMGIVDPERLAFDSTSEYPPEVLAAVEQVLERVRQYMRADTEDTDQ